MSNEISIAIETSCRNGGVALGRGDELLGAVNFDAHGRSSTHLITSLDELLASHSLEPADVSQVYVSVGPGSFTGVRVGVTTARTFAQACGDVQCVAVPTSLAIAQRTAELEWDNLGVVLDTGDGRIYVTQYARRDGRIFPANEPVVMSPADWLAAAPRPILLTGEGLGYHELSGDGVQLAQADLWLPDVKILWRIGRQLANAGEFTEYHKLLPIYARPPVAEQLQEEAGSGREVKGKADG